MSSSTTASSTYYTNYSIIAPLSMALTIISVIICCIILMIIALTKPLHTVTHLLVCNTCISSILYCVVQFNNYIYLLFITWDTSDLSCRWRGYFSYMSITAVVYSYFLQAVSRLFFAVLSTKYRWLTSFKIHYGLIFINWIIVLIVPLPAILTKDIPFHPASLCWVPKTHILHLAYTIFAYYLIPIIAIVAIYILIYRRLRRGGTHAFTQGPQRKSNRDLEVLRNIMILLSIYILGGVPAIFYMVSGIHVFYSIGIVSVTLTVVIEKSVSTVLDREIRKILSKFLCRSTMQVQPVTVNTAMTAPK